MRCRQIEKQNRQNEIEREKLHSFDPVRFAVTADLKENVNGHDDGDDFRHCKFQIHRATKGVGEENQNRSDEQSDLQTRADGDPDAEIHFVFQRDSDGGRVFGRVADDRDHDDADKDFVRPSEVRTPQSIRQEIRTATRRRQ